MTNQLLEVVLRSKFEHSYSQFPIILIPQTVNRDCNVENAQSRYNKFKIITKNASKRESVHKSLNFRELKGFHTGGNSIVH